MNNKRVLNSQDEVPSIEQISMRYKFAFLSLFCIASIIQGMYQTYFVSILTTLEKLYHVPSKTAGALLSITELGQIASSIIVSYHGGRGNRPRWIASCMFILAFAALIATLPHSLFDSTYPNSFEYLSSHSTIKPTSGPTRNTTEINLPLCISMKRTIDETTSDDTINNHLIEPDQTTKKILYTLITFGFSLLLVGLGSTALTTLGIPYIYEIVSEEESPLYLGITIGLRVLGPAFGFLLGSYCLKLDVDFYKVGQRSDFATNLEKSIGRLHDHIGAWWLGFYIISIPLFIMTLPMCIFANSYSTKYSTQRQLPNLDKSSTQDGPSYLEKTQDIESENIQKHELKKSIIDKARSSKEEDEYIHNDNDINQWNTSCSDTNLSLHCTETNELCLKKDYLASNYEIKSIESSSTNILASTNNIEKSNNILTCFKRVLSNRLFLLRLISCVLHILPIAGFFTFLPKYLSEQYYISASAANSISGLSGILIVGFGAFLGGTYIRVFRVTSKKVSVWIASTSLIYMIGMLVLINLGCPQSKIVSYDSRDNLRCYESESCSCKEAYYPVCKGDVTYLSPCLAGCTSASFSNSSIYLDGCLCSLDPSNDQKIDGIPLGLCESPICHNLKWYIIVFAGSTLVHATAEVGAMIYNLKSVDSQDRTFALGMISLGTALFGNIPCSIIYGALIDSTCIYWDKLYKTDSLTEIGSCKIYDNDRFRYYLHGITALIMSLAFIIDCMIVTNRKDIKFYHDVEQT